MSSFYILFAVCCLDDGKYSVSRIHGDNEKDLHQVPISEFSVVLLAFHA